MAPPFSRQRSVLWGLLEAGAARRLNSAAGHAPTSPGDGGGHEGQELKGIPQKGAVTAAGVVEGVAASRRH